MTCGIVNPAAGEDVCATAGTAAAASTAAERAMCRARLARGEREDIGTPGGNGLGDFASSQTASKEASGERGRQCRQTRMEGCEDANDATDCLQEARCHSKVMYSPQPTH